MMTMMMIILPNCWKQATNKQTAKNIENLSCKYTKYRKVVLDFTFHMLYTFKLDGDNDFRQQQQHRLT